MENKFKKPKSYDELINQFGKFMVDKIYNKKWHLWRMQSGIELIHYTFDLNKQKQLWENWQLMSDEDKKISDMKCIQLFGINNEKLNNYCLTTGYNKEKTKFNSKYEEILKNVIQTTREKRQNKFPTTLYEINIPIIKHKKFPFLNYLNANEFMNESMNRIDNNIKFNLTDNQLKDMCETLGMPENEFKTTFEYLLNGMQFEAWVANTCEQFIKSGITIEQFKFIIQDFEKFKNMFNNSSDDMQEMFLFGEICYLSYLNDKNDDRYYYLIQAMKNHGK